MRGAEEAVNAVLAALQNNWVAQAAIVNAQYTDGVAVGTPAAWYNSRIPSAEVPASPAVFVLEDPWDDKNMDTANQWEETRLILVDVMVEDPDPQRLQALIWRNVKVVRNILGSWSTSQLDQLGYFVTGMKGAPGPLWEKEANAFSQDHYIQVTLESIEGMNN